MTDYDPEFAELNKRINKVVTVPSNPYSWAGTYSAGSDAFVYRRYRGGLPEYAEPYAKDAPAHVLAFCDKHDIDVAVDDELVPGRVRKVRTDKFSDEAP